MLPPYTLDTIRRSFNPRAAAQPLMFRYVIRPASFPVTYALLRLRMTANQATLVGLLVGVLGSALFMVGTPYAVAWGTVCYLTFLIFDFVDGNIARTTDSATYWGKYFDGIADTLIEVLLPIALGVGFFRSTGSFPLLIIAGALSLAALYASFLFTRLSFFNRWMDAELRAASREGLPHRELNPLRTKRFPLTVVTNATTDLKIMSVIFVGLSGLSPLLLAFVFVAIGLHTVPLIIIPILDAAHDLNVRRTSKWDPRAQQ